LLLYRYWLFFKLLDPNQSSFDIRVKDISDLIEETNQQVKPKVKAGKIHGTEVA
jgi:hypothetical protein